MPAHVTDPLIVLSVEGREASDIARSIIEFKLEDNMKKVDQLTLTIVDRDLEFSYDERLATDASWTIRFGYGRDLSPPRTFRLKYFKPRYSADGAYTTLVLTLMGAGQELVRTRSGRNWGRVPSSEIARSIAKRHGLKLFAIDSADATPTPYVQGASESDFDYLSRLAADIDFEFYVVDDTLHYVARDFLYAEPPVMRLVYGDANTCLLSFEPEVKTTKGGKVKGLAASTSHDGDASKAVVAAIDNANVGGLHLAPDLVATQGRGDPASRPKNGKDAVAKVARLKRDYDVDNILGKTKRLQVNLETGRTSVVELVGAKDAAADVSIAPETSPAKVAKMARSKKRHTLDQMVKADMSCIGTPRVRPGKTFEIVVPDRRLSGLWHATDVVHTMSGSSYTVTAKLRRGAWNDPRARGKSNRQMVWLGGIKGSFTIGPGPRTWGTPPSFYFMRGGAVPASQPVVKISAETGRVIPP